MNYSGLDDETLLRLIAQQQAEALGVLYDRYARLVYSVAYQATSHAELAEEVTQDTFLRIWQHAGSFNPQQGRAASWMTRITRNRVIDLYRRRQTRSDGHTVYLEEMPDFDISDDEQDVEADVEVAQRRLEVRLALRQLPLEQRKVLAMAYFRGLTQEEISRSLNEPLGTVKTRMRLAMQKLRSLFQSDEAG